MPPVALWVASAVTSAALEYAIVTTAIADIIFSVTYYATMAAMFYGASRLLTKNPKLPSFMADASTRSLMVRQAAAPRRIVYGKAKVSGVLAFMHSTGAKNEYLHLVVVLAAHEIEQILEVYLNDELLTFSGSTGGAVTGKYAGFVRVNFKYGGAGQTADSDLVSECSSVWTTDHKLSDCAYIYVRLKYDATLFPSGLPNFSAVVKGKKVYDHRTGLTAWSDNAALCLFDYMTHTRFGLGAASTDFDLTALDAAANVCDESMVLADTSTEARYTVNGTVDTSEKPATVIEALLSAMAGRVAYSGGLWVIKPGAYEAPSTTLTISDLRGPISVQTKLSRREQANAVKGVFVSEDNQYQAADFPAVTNATYLAEDGGEQLWHDIQLPFTNSSAMAQRIAKTDLERTRQGITVKLQCKLTALNVRIGDTVGFTYARCGWTAKEFEVTEFSLVSENDAGGNPLLGVDLTLRETAAGVWDWADGEETTIDLAPNTDLPDPFTVAAPTGLTLSLVGFRQPDGSYVPQLKVSWTAPAEQTVQSGGLVRIQYKKHADANWSEWGTVKGDQVFDVIAISLLMGIAYDVQVRSENVLGVSSAWVQSLNYTVPLDAGTAAVPTAITYTAGNDANYGEPPIVGPNGVKLCCKVEWGPTTDANIVGYEWTTSATDSDAAATLAMNPVGPGYVSAPLVTTRKVIVAFDLLLGDAYFRVRSVNSAGVRSAWAGGTTNINASLMQRPAVLGTTSTQAAAGNDSRITGAAQKSSNLSDLASVSTARSNLGLSTGSQKRIFSGVVNVTLGGGGATELFTISLSGAGFGAKPACGMCGCVDPKYVIVYESTNASNSAAVAYCQIQSTDGSTVPATTTPVTYLFTD